MAVAAQCIPPRPRGEAEDIAEAVAYLIGEAAKQVTGQTIHVNGGHINNMT